ncbi:MAG: glutamyl-tRNA amidotransferase [Clostridia bacterium]|nr:glutamyl-tRNA amidotransferase [Clostridia bacterium]
MFNKKTTKKETWNEGKTSPICGRGRKAFRFYCSAILCGALIFGTATTAFAANDPISVVNNLSDFIFGLIRAVGLILLGWGIVQVGLSFSSHDPSQRSNGFLTLAGGVVITFAKEILTLITG